MRAIVAILVCGALAYGAQSTIDLSTYRDSKQYSYAEASYTVGEHEYRLVNIKPLSESDTTCISALVIDKRKYLLIDLEMKGTRHGLVVPKEQPIEDALVVVKASPLDAKTFLILKTGKVVTLPGDRLIVDKAGNTVLSVWDNDGVHHLTVFDYRRLRLIVSTTPIAQPKGWYTNGLAYFFEATDGTYYTLDLFSKAVAKAPGGQSGLDPLPYAFDPSSLDVSACCGKSVLTK